MERIGEIHAEDVKVYNPDGSLTTPFLPDHAGELQFSVRHLRLSSRGAHRRIRATASGPLASAFLRASGSSPSTLPDGRVLPPTGKELTIRIATLARWKDGRIVEEHLFWDNAEWNRQIGLKE